MLLNCYKLSCVTVQQVNFVVGLYPEITLQTLISLLYTSKFFFKCNFFRLFMNLLIKFKKKNIRPKYIRNQRLFVQDIFYNLFFMTIF